MSDAKDRAPAPGFDAPTPSTNELEHIRYALDQAAIVATTDVRGRISYVNDKFCQISGYSRDELLGRDHRILNSGLHPRQFMRQLWDTISSGQVWRGEIRNRRKTGDFYWVDTTIVPFLNERGRPWQYMAIRYDITERKRNERRLQEQATLASLGEMAAVVAHEVRNPLAGIRGGVQLLGAHLPESDAEGADFVREMVARIDSLNAAITDLLGFARLREPEVSAGVDLSVLLSDVVKSLRYDPSLADVHWQVEGHCSVLVAGDENQLRLLFTNLALNAAQAAGAGGHVHLSARSLDGHCVVEVEDDGPGIGPGARERVFEPFFTTKHRGTGLGLPTAKRIVEMHAGEISVLDRTSGGTTVRVTLPTEPAGE